jgi:hypothetical protein
MRTALAAALLCAFGGPAMAQTGPGDPPAYGIEYSSAPMIRNAALADVAFLIVERGTDWAADRWTATSSHGVPQAVCSPVSDRPR